MMLISCKPAIDGEEIWLECSRCRIGDGPRIAFGFVRSSSLLTLNQINARDSNP
jgi:hypothetical protein